MLKRGDNFGIQLEIWYFERVPKKCTNSKLEMFRRKDLVQDEKMNKKYKVKCKIQLSERDHTFFFKSKEPHRNKHQI